MKFVLICLLLCAFIFPVVAQENRLDSSPQDFRLFFSKFKSFVKKNNRAAIASMTVFPFKYGFDTGDEGTLNKAQFLNGYNKKFAESLKEAVSEENPLFAESKKGIYVISTEDAAHLIFIKRGGVYNFFSYIVEP